jgi:hypothetical protein
MRLQISCHEYLKFAEFLSDRIGDFTYNEVLCGSGLSLMHEYLTGTILTPNDIGALIKTGKANQTK